MVICLKEEWKWVNGFDGVYQISNLGRIKSFKRMDDGYILSNQNAAGDYLRVVLNDTVSMKRRSVAIHILVVEHFIGEIPKGFHVHHKDGNKQNNRVDNLEMLTPKEHAIETIKHNPHILDGMIAYNKGRFIDDGRKRYQRNRFSTKRKFQKGRILQYTLDENLVGEYNNAMDAYRKTGVCQRNILQVANKEPYNSKGSVRKQAGGYIWRFEKEVM